MIFNDSKYEVVQERYIKIFFWIIYPFSKFVLLTMQFKVTNTYENYICLENFLQTFFLYRVKISFKCPFFHSWLDSWNWMLFFFVQIWVAFKAVSFYWMFLLFLFLTLEWELLCISAKRVFIMQNLISSTVKWEFLWCRWNCNNYCNVIQYTILVTSVY